MAVDMFMVFTPDVKGESLDKTYKDKIDVLAWSWGLSNSGSAQMGGGAGSGKVNVQDLSFTKYIDAATPYLMLAGCNGKHYDTAKLIVRKAGGDSAVEYVTITMYEVLVSSISTGGSGGEDRLTENVSLNFGKVEFDYTPQDGTGAAGTAIPMTWNIQANVKDI
jgi:type VI secretion system secreted protein Hcp